MIAPPLGRVGQLLSAVSAPLRVVLVGPSGWVTYVVMPAISAIVALLAAYFGHRWSLREQAKALRTARAASVREGQVRQNTALETLVTGLEAIESRVEAARSAPAAPPPTIEVSSVLASASECGVSGVLAPLLAAQAQYATAQQAWRKTDEASTASVASSLDAMTDAVRGLAVITRSILDSGRDRLDRLDRKGAG